MPIRRKKSILQSLHKKLNDNDYLCDQQFASRVATTIANQPTGGSFLFGPAGTGKSFLPETLAKIMDAEQVFYQCFPGTREEDLLVKMLPDEETRSGIKLFDGPVLQAVHLSNNGDDKTPVVLTLDEWDKTRPSADSFLLDFLQTGRVTFQGKVHKANLDRLLVYVTMNDERDLSEPLLRRMPMILFDHLPAELVYRALKTTHPDSKHLANAVVLYQRCVMSNMSKPATIQELRQMLDAIETLGKHADWDSLVFQYVTKTEENHMLLKLNEDEPVSFHVPSENDEEDGKEGDNGTEQERDGKLKPSAYTLSEDQAGGLASAKGNGITPAMPNMVELKDFDLDWQGNEPAEPLQTFGILRRGSEEYDDLVHLVSKPNKSPADLGAEGDAVLASVSDHDIRLLRPVPLTEAHNVLRLFDSEGEVMFIEPMATMKDIKELSRRKEEFEITKYTTNEIIGKAPGIHLRCRPGEGAEIIVDLNAYGSFADLFGFDSYGEVSEGDWLAGDTGKTDLANAVVISPNSYGIMFRRRYLQGVPGLHKALIKCRYDVWGDGWDNIPSKKLPLLDEFLQEDYRILQGAKTDHMFYMLDNVIFGFFGKDNDMFGFKILDEMSENTYRYLDKWIPEQGIEVRFEVTVDQALPKQAFISDLGYEPNTEGYNELCKQTKSGLEVIIEESGKMFVRGEMAKKDMTYKKLLQMIRDIKQTWLEVDSYEHE